MVGDRTLTGFLSPKLLAFLLAAAALPASAYTIDCSSGTAFNPGVRGQNPARGVGNRAEILKVSFNTSVRSLPAGGLDADTYDWRNNHSGSDIAHYTTTLDVLRELRDHSSWGVFTANVWGAGYKQGGEFVCQYLGDAGVARLAADWVRYINRIVQIYREGDPVTDPRDAAILESINWTDRTGRPLPRLLKPGEPPVPKAIYWEIGNEPEGDFPGYIRNHALSKEEYSRRYRLIASAMKAEDPGVLVGPCCLDARYVSQILADGGVVDFVAYHPYYVALYNAWPGSQPSVPDLERALAGLGSWMRIQKTRWAAFNRPLIASEYNPINWPAIYQPVARSMAHALAYVESVLVFAAEGVMAAHHWHSPNFFPVPGQAAERLQKRLGNILISQHSEGPNFRLYATRESGKHSVTLWGLNFSDSADRTMTISLTGLSPEYRYRARVHRLKSPGPDTSLTSTDAVWSTDPQIVDDVSNFTVTFEDATLTVIEVDPVAEPPAPLSVRNVDVGGGAFGRQAGVWDAANGEAGGLNNIGLLISTWGKVTRVGQGYFYISDGTPIDDGSGHQGIRVDFPYSGTEGRYVKVTGISSCLRSGARLIRLIRPRSGSDIVEIDMPQ